MPAGRRPGSSGAALPLAGLPVFGRAVGAALRGEALAQWQVNAAARALHHAFSARGGRRAAIAADAAAVELQDPVGKQQAENEGLDRIFRDAGFEWREPGCSMCLGMNPDRLEPGERCASTSNRNFEGRQGVGGRTHLVSPAMAAAAAIAGHFVDISR